MSKLETWSQLTEAVDAPPEIAAAFATGRPELLKLVKPRAHTAEEVAVLYKIIAVLIQTNYELQVHSRDVVKHCASLQGQLKGFVGAMQRLTEFASFKSQDE